MKHIVSFQKEPYNFNEWQHLVVEATTREDAIAIVRDKIRDLGEVSRYRWRVRDYAAPPAGRIIGTWEGA